MDKLKTKFLLQFDVTDIIRMKQDVVNEYKKLYPNCGIGEIQTVVIANEMLLKKLKIKIN